MMNTESLVRRCYNNVMEYRAYVQKLPSGFFYAIENSPLNLEVKLKAILQEALPVDLWKELVWVNWNFPNENYKSIDEFIVKNNLE